MASNHLDFIIDVIANTGDAVANINDVDDALGSLNIGELAGEALNELNESLSNSLEICKDVSYALVNNVVDGIELASDAMNQLLEITIDVADKLKELSDLGADIQESYFGVYNYMGYEAGEEIVSFTNSLQELYGLDADSFIANLDGILGTVSNMNMQITEAVETTKAFSLFAKDLSAFSGYSLEDITSKLEGAISLGTLSITSPLVRALNMTDQDLKTFREFNTIQERAQFLLYKGEAVRGTYEKWLQTSAGKVEIFNQSNSRLAGALEKLAVSIFAKVTPALTAVNNLIESLITKLSSFLNLDITSGDANMAESIEGVTGGISSISNSLDSVSDSAKKAKKNLASFDDVIQLNDSSTSGDSDIQDLGYYGGIDLSGWGIDEANQELSDFEKRLKEIGEYLSSGQWEQAGKALNALFVDTLNNIDWTSIKESASDLGMGIAQFINGLSEDKELGKLIGNNISQAVNTAVTFVEDFTSELNWGDIGENISQSWKGFWESFDSSKLARALYNMINGVFKSLSGFVSDMWKTQEFDLDSDGIVDTLANGWSLAGWRISDFINNLFGNWTTEDITNTADCVIDFIHGIFNTVGVMLDNLNVEEIKGKILLLIDKLMQGFIDNAPQWGSVLGTVIDGIIDMLNELISRAESTELGEAIRQFIENSHIGDLIFKVMEIQLKLSLKKLGMTLYMMIAELIIDPIVEAIYNTKEFCDAIALFIGGLLFVITFKVKEFGQTLVEWWTGTVLPFFGEISEFLSEKWNYLIELVTGFFTNIGEALSNWWSGVQEWWSGVKTWFSGLVSDITSFGTSILNGIKTVFNPDTWRQIGSDALNGLWNGIQSIWNSIKNWWNSSIAGELFSFDLPDWLADFTGTSGFSLSIPKLARGGIVNQSTIANIGEAGREAVLPLENNTGWMDDLADKLVSKMVNNGSNGSTIIIDMSKYMKNTYTRSEMITFAKQVVEALKLYGVNVSMNY